MKLAGLFVAASLFASAQTRVYQDPQKRFEFTYPAAFGAPSAGTDSGFRDRVAAIRFSEFSAGVHAGASARMVSGFMNHSRFHVAILSSVGTAACTRVAKDASVAIAMSARQCMRTTIACGEMHCYFQQ